jgi:hypothetical protein
MSAAAPAPAGVLLETTRQGQVRIVVPLPRRPYPTGVQVPCVACARAGVSRPGMPYRFAGDPTALCIPCWRAEERRRQRAADEELLAAYWEGVGGVEAGDDGLVTVAEVEAAACPACGQAEPGPDCWLCSYTWLAQARDQFEAELELDDQEVAERFAAIQALSEAEDRVAELSGWVERVRACLDAYGQTHPGSRGRPVELLADLMARDALARATRRGRPGALHLVAAVVAVDADWRSGRRALPGRGRTAELAGCSERAVTAAWRRGVDLRWMVRTRRGRRLSFAERCELHRSNDRAEYDLVALHRSEVDVELRAQWVPLALGVLGDLLQHAQALLDAAEDDLETARARYGAWTDWTERVQAARRRQAVARVLDEVCAWPAASRIASNIFPPRTASRGEHVSSCSYRGLRYSPSIMIHVKTGWGSAGGRESTNGASRSPTEEFGDLGSARYGDRQDYGSQHVVRPRTFQGKRRRSRRAAAPEWASWAYPLARQLVACGWWPWLAGSPLPWVAAVLGATLGPDWDAPAVVDLVRTRCGPPAPAEDVHAPSAYLAALLRQALSGPGVPAHPARAHDAACHAAAATAHDTAAAEHERLRAEFDARDAAAAASSGAGRAAARAVLAGIQARRAAAAPAAAEPWPETAQPGAGIPAPRRPS